MEIKEFYKKVDKKKLKAALNSDDPNALNQLAGDGMAELTPEQLDYVAGGVSWEGYDSDESD